MTEPSTEASLPTNTTVQASSGNSDREESHFSQSVEVDTMEPSNIRIKSSKLKRENNRFKFTFSLLVWIH
jgi:hypothetical protein